jgi:uncharacterized integral membrane protein
MRVVIWTIRLLLFLLLAALAAKNVEPVTLRLYFDKALQAPLIVVLFCAFAAGIAFGMLALTGILFRQRKEIGLLKRQAGPTRPEAPPA